MILQFIDIGSANLDSSPKKEDNYIVRKHLLAGGVAGAVSKTCTAPLDRLKVFLQIQEQKKGLYKTLTILLKEGGIFSFWRGNYVNVLKIVPESSIKFTIYEKLKHEIIQETNRPLEIHERFISASTAGALSQSLIYPMELLKTRLCIRKTGQYNGITHAVSTIYHREGFKSFYRGFTPNLVGIFFFAGIDLTVYETCKMYLNSRSKIEHSSNLLIMWCGSISSTLGQLCTYPLHLIRTRLQASEIKIGTDKENNSVRGLVKSILKKDGILGFYKGIAINYLKAIPSVSISYIVYESTSSLLGVSMT